MNFQQILITLRYRKWTLISCIVITVLTTMLVNVFLPKQYIATTSLILEQRGLDPLTGSIVPAQLLSGYMATQKGVITSTTVALKVVDALNLKDDPEQLDEYALTHQTGDIRNWIANNLLKKLEVALPTDSSIFNLSFSSRKPEFSAAVANAFAQAYIETAVELKAQPARINADWFDHQLDALREKMELSYGQLSKYQQQHGIVTLQDQLDIEDAKLAELAKQLTEIQAQTISLRSRKRLVSEALTGKSSKLSLQEVMENHFIQNLKSDLTRAETKFSELARDLNENHPKYMEAKAEVDHLKGKIYLETKSVLNGLSINLITSERHQQNLIKALNEQKNKVLRLKKQHDEMAVLQREVENTKKAYDTAMQRTLQTRMESEIDQTNVAILNQAVVPLFPAKPKVKLNMLISLVVGTLLGLSFTLLSEFYNPKVRTLFEIREVLDLPVLGIVKPPMQFNKKEKQLMIPYTGRRA